VARDGPFVAISPVANCRDLKGLIAIELPKAAAYPAIAIGVVLIIGSVVLSFDNPEIAASIQRRPSWVIAGMCTLAGVLAVVAGIGTFAGTRTSPACASGTLSRRRPPRVIRMFATQALWHRVK